MRIYSRATGQIGETLSAYLRFQESCSKELVSSFEKSAIAQFEAALSKVLDQRKVEVSQPNLDQRRTSDASNASDRTLPQYTFEDRSQLKPRAISAQPALHLKKTYSCRPTCHCPCHIRREYHLPWLMKFLLGELHLYWRSQKASIPCSCSHHLNVTMIYRFPRYLLSRYISMVVQTTYLDGPELLLRVPHVLPWTHLLWKYSVRGDLLAIQRMYASRMASPFDVDPHGRNALIYASKQETANVVTFLLEQGTDSNQPDQFGKPPSELLLRRSFGGMYGDQGAEIMRRLLNNQDPLEEFGFTTLHKIVLGIEFKDLQSVLEATTDTINVTDSVGRTALFWAVICDDIDRVRLLLSYGADVNVKDLRGCAPIDFVRGSAVCKSLLAYGAKNNITSRSSPHEQAIEYGSVEVMSLFAAAGFDIDKKDNDNETPLLNAIYAGHTALAQRLIELGANVNSANLSSRDSALHFASAFDRPAILKTLLEKGADYNALDCNGRNLAHCAAQKGSTELVKVMTGMNLDGLDLSLRDYEGKTPADYISERIVMTDMEVGVHEAWEDMMAGLRSSSNHTPRAQDTGARRVEELDVQEEKLQDDDFDSLKIPGAFPVVTVQELETSAF